MHRGHMSIVDKGSLAHRADQEQLGFGNSLGPRTGCRPRLAAVAPSPGRTATPSRGTQRAWVEKERSDPALAEEPDSLCQLWVHGSLILTKGGPRQKR